MIKNDHKNDRVILYRMHKIVCTAKILYIKSLMYKRSCTIYHLLVSQRLEDDHRFSEPDRFLKKKLSKTILKLINFTTSSTCDL